MHTAGRVRGDDRICGSAPNLTLRRDYPFDATRCGRAYWECDATRSGADSSNMGTLETVVIEKWIHLVILPRVGVVAAALPFSVRARRWSVLRSSRTGLGGTTGPSCRPSGDRTRPQPVRGRDRRRIGTRGCGTAGVQQPRVAAPGLRSSATGATVSLVVRDSSGLVAANVVRRQSVTRACSSRAPLRRMSQCMHSPYCGGARAGGRRSPLAEPLVGCEGSGEGFRKSCPVLAPLPGALSRSGTAFEGEGGIPDAA